MPLANIIVYFVVCMFIVSIVLMVYFLQKISKRIEQMNEQINANNFSLTVLRENLNSLLDDTYIISEHYRRLK